MASAQQRADEAQQAAEEARNQLEDQERNMFKMHKAMKDARTDAQVRQAASTG